MLKWIAILSNIFLFILVLVITIDIGHLPRGDDLFMFVFMISLSFINLRYIVVNESIKKKLSEHL